jgi:DNA-binding XRE family transcriptional regulator
MRLLLLEVTPEELRQLRARHDWSLQDLANHSGINKAYLSEYENEKRRLSDDQLEMVANAFSKHQHAGASRPRLVWEGRTKLVFVNASGQLYRPPIAHLRWIEDDGRSYSMFVGNGEP